MHFIGLYFRLKMTFSVELDASRDTPSSALPLPIRTHPLPFLPSFIFFSASAPVLNGRAWNGGLGETSPLSPRMVLRRGYISLDIKKSPHDLLPISLCSRIKKLQHYRKPNFPECPSAALIYSLGIPLMKLYSACHIAPITQTKCIETFSQCNPE